MTSMYVWVHSSDSWSIRKVPKLPAHLLQIQSICNRQVDDWKFSKVVLSYRWLTNLQCLSLHRSENRLRKKVSLVVGHSNNHSQLSGINPGPQDFVFPLNLSPLHFFSEKIQSIQFLFETKLSKDTWTARLKFHCQFPQA